MILSIITINRNNASGLRKTMQSVLDQSFKDFEYVVVDGASTDGSFEVIREYADSFGDRLTWVSEPDNGLYNAMNKGIAMSSGEYIQILNSGDMVKDSNVLDKAICALRENEFPNILYGNMLKAFPDGRLIKDKCFAGQEITMFGMYSGTLNHDPVFIKRALFSKYGPYDEELRICSDWEWYLKAIVFGGETPKYKDFDVTVFDMTGISENAGNKEKIQQERKQVLERELCPAILSDYNQYHSDIYMMRRIHRHPISNKIVWLIERILFKIEKYQNRKKGIQKWG